MKKLLLTIILGITAFVGSFSQVQLPPAISQYMLNPMSSNPGYAGFYDMMIVSNLFRTQPGTNFASYTNTLNLHTSLPIDKMGAGINIGYDQIGITKSINLDLALSYKLEFGANKLSFGVQGSFYRLENDFNKLEYSDEYFKNEFIPENNQPFNTPNFGTGVMYSGRKFFGGISVPRILRVSKDFNSIYETIANNDTTETSTSRTARYNPYFTASFGTIIHATNLIEIKPSFMVKYVDELGGVLVDLNTSALINKTIWTGISFRNSVQRTDVSSSNGRVNLITSIGLMGQLQINEKLKAGLSYDLPLNGKLARALIGRYPIELMVSYNIMAFEEQGIHTFLF